MVQILAPLVRRSPSSALCAPAWPVSVMVGKSAARAMPICAMPANARAGSKKSASLCPLVGRQRKPAAGVRLG